MTQLLGCYIDTTAVLAAAAPFNFRLPQEADLLSDGLYGRRCWNCTSNKIMHDFLLILPTDVFANSNLVFLSQKEKQKTMSGKDADAPVLCETICRPMEAQDLKKAGVRCIGVLC